MNEDIIKGVVVGAIVGLLIAYYFLWGKSYSELNSKYDKLNQDYFILKQNYDQLNQNYITLQSNYTNLKTECTQALKDYKACIGRENFFTWVQRFQSLLGLAKLVGII